MSTPHGHCSQTRHIYWFSRLTSSFEVCIFSILFYDEHREQGTLRVHLVRLFGLAPLTYLVG